MRFQLVPVIFLLSLPLQAQEAKPEAPVLSTVPLVPGRLIERVTSSLDRAQHFAVYLPSSYRTDGKSPVLFLMDPRGRAMLPLKLAQDRAEKHGYIVISSYNTLSDGSNQPNIDAMAAMLTDVQRHFAADQTRIYLVGFSGTARIAWDFAFGLRGTVAGIIGFGAGVPPGFDFSPAGFSGPIPWVYYGGAGTSDFNYEELMSLDDELDSRKVDHRIQYYDGPHAWAPRQVMEDAIDWIELQAMKRGMTPRKQPWIDSLLTESLARARALDAAGEKYWAWRRYRGIAIDFEGVADVAPVAAQAVALEKSSEVKQGIKQQSEMISRNHDYLRKLSAFVKDYRTAKTPPSVEKSLKILRVSDLKKAKADTRDSSAALAASRLLSHVEAFSSFYEPRDYIDGGDPARALLMLDLAEAVRGPSRGICNTRAEALDLLKRSAEAAKARECDILAHPPNPDSR